MGFLIELNLGLSSLPEQTETTIMILTFRAINKQPSNVSTTVIFENLPAASSRSPTRMPIGPFDLQRPLEPKSALRDEN
jgi:hypothetical protein